MECGPKGCPLTAWTNMSVTDRKAQRKSIAERLYTQGFTMEAIATQLGVSVGTIHKDLIGFSQNEKPSRPRGGRPKGSTKPRKPPETQAKHEKIISFSGNGMSASEIASEVGVGQRMVHRVLEVEHARQDAEAQIDPTTLSLTAQEKLNAAIRQHKRKLDMEFEQRVQSEIRKRMAETVLPHYRETYAEYQAVIKARKGFMDKSTFKKIWTCLHTERLAQLLSVPHDKLDEKLARRYDEAFHLFSALEKRLLDEKESPTSSINIPSNLAEWDAMRAKATAERKAKRMTRSAMSVQ